MVLPPLETQPKRPSLSLAAAAVTVSETPPANPGEGDLWWNEDDGRLYVFYEDADTSQWVDASPEAAAAVVQTPNLQEVTDEECVNQHNHSEQAR